MTQNWREAPWKGVKKSQAITHTLGWVLSKQTKPQKITHIKENMEKLETLCTVWGNVKWCGHCEKQYNSPSKKLKIELPYDLAIPLLGIYS